MFRRGKPKDLGTSDSRLGAEIPSGGKRGWRIFSAAVGVAGGVAVGVSGGTLYEAVAAGSACGSTLALIVGSCVCGQ
jgi:hypothetical protein